MGNFYTNLTLRSTDSAKVAAALRGRPTLVSPAHGQTVVVFDEESEAQDPKVISALASRLSATLGCLLLAVMNHDDDVLTYQLYSQGTLLDEYNSSPTYFDPDAEPTAPAGGSAQTLCEAFGSSDVSLVESILRGEDAYVFATDRHQALADALVLSPFAVGFGFDTITAGELPVGLDLGSVIRTS